MLRRQSDLMDRLQNSRQTYNVLAVDSRVLTAGLPQQILLCSKTLLLSEHAFLQFYYITNLKAAVADVYPSGTRW